MRFFGRSRKDLAELCDVHKAGSPSVFSLKKGDYRLIYPFSVFLFQHEILPSSVDFSFGCSFLTKKISVYGFQSTSRESFSERLEFFGYPFFERRKILSLAHEKALALVSPGEILALVDSLLIENYRW